MPDDLQSRIGRIKRLSIRELDREIALRILSYQPAETPATYYSGWKPKHYSSNHKHLLELIRHLNSFTIRVAIEYRSEGMAFVTLNNPQDSRFPEAIVCHPFHTARTVCELALIWLESNKITAKVPQRASQKTSQKAKECS